MMLTIFQQMVRLGRHPRTFVRVDRRNTRSLALLDRVGLTEDRPDQISFSDGGIAVAGWRVSGVRSDVGRRSEPDGSSCHSMGLAAADRRIICGVAHLATRTMLPYAITALSLIWPVSRAIMLIVLLPARIATELERQRTERASLARRRHACELDTARLRQAKNALDRSPDR
jgi:hypothetical protein